MLQAIRDSFVGWVAWLVVILISIPFIVMGVTDFGTPVRETPVIEVNGEVVTQSDYQRLYQARRQRMQRQLGTAYRVDVHDKQVQDTVIEVMIEEKLLMALSEENKLHVGDEELASTIRNDVTFQQDGQFDYDLYKSKLGEAGLTLDRYENYLREQLRLNVIPRMVRESSFITPQEAERYSALAGQKRDVDYVIIGQDKIGEEVVIQDEQAEAYYDDHLSEYLRPAQVKFEYIRLNVDTLIERVEISEEEQRRYYDENIDSYVVDEQRQASHILLSLDEGKTLDDAPEVAETLSAIQEKLSAGEKFEDLAEQYSQDPGSASKGGDLGQVLRGVMVPPFEEALFAMQEVGKISEPVQTNFGIHLIRLDGITPKQVKSFDDAKAEVRETLVKQQAEELYYDQVDQLVGISYENPDSLEPVAEALTIEMQSSDWLSEDNKAPGVEGNRDVLAAVFSERLKTQMTNSDPIELAANDIVIVRVNDSRPEFQMPFEEVIEEARDAAKKVAMAEKLQAYADSLLARYQVGEPLQELVDKEKLSLETVDQLTRRNNQLPRDLPKGIFAMSAPENDTPVAALVPLADDSIALVILRKVTAPDEAVDETMVKVLHSRNAVGETDMLLSNIREDAQITIHREQL